MPLVVARVASSLRAEFEGRGVPGPHGAGLWVGMAMSGLLCLEAAPTFGAVFGLAAMVLWIIYWVNIARLSRRLARLDSPGGSAG